MSSARLADTIVAPITASGGAVGVVRLSGPQAWRLASCVFTPWSPQARLAAYGRFSHGDDGIAVPFESGHSYTGEESVELSVHGSHASVSALVAACLEAGARMADPGEFTLRAFLNGRMDLTQAEGVRESVEALTEGQLRQANLMRDGALGERVRAIREEVLGVLTAVDASTDFSEEIGPVDRPLAVARLKKAVAAISALQRTERTGRIARRGLTVAIMGRPNVGKSSLFNAVLGSDRAIVTEIPGTTRDTVEEFVSVDGLLCRFIDTAGVREAADPVEAEGIRRAQAAARLADLVWFVYDASIGWTQEDARLVPSAFVCIANKCDLVRRAECGFPVSAKTGQGIARLLDTLNAGDVVGDLSEPAVRERHLAPLRKAKSALRRAAQTLSGGLPDDLAAVDLQAAARCLGEITGETATPDVIERVFHDFCVGK